MMEKSTCSSAGHPAPASPSPDSEEVSKTREVTLRWSLQGWLFAHTPVGWYGKMSPEYCRAGKDAILPRFFHCSQDGKSLSRIESGRTQDLSARLPEPSAWVGECLTLNIPEWNNFRDAPVAVGDQVGRRAKRGAFASAKVARARAIPQNACYDITNSVGRVF